MRSEVLLNFASAAFEYEPHEPDGNNLMVWWQTNDGLTFDLLRQLRNPYLALTPYRGHTWCRSFDVSGDAVTLMTRTPAAIHCATLNSLWVSRRAASELLGAIEQSMCHWCGEHITRQQIESGEALPDSHGYVHHTCASEALA